MPDPSNFELSLIPNSDAPGELQSIGRQYWQHDGIDIDSGTVRWAYRVKDIDLRSWTRSANHAAAAGVVVSLPGSSCGTCGNELTLTSRSALDDAWAGRKVKCRACNGQVDQYAERLLDPEERLRREQRLEREKQKEEQREREAKFREAKRSAIESRYPSDSQPDWKHLIGKASVAERVGALAIVHMADDVDGLIHLNFDGIQPVAPSQQSSYDLFVEAFHAGLFIIHRSSPPEAFVWDDEEPTELAGPFYPTQARYITTGEGHPVERIQVFSEQLRDSLTIGTMSSKEQRELQKLSRKLVADEALRYFQFWFKKHKFPDPLEKQLELLRSYAFKGAEGLSLGRLYSIIWSSLRSTTEVQARHAMMSRQKATSFGVKKFTEAVERALNDPNYYAKSFDEMRDLPLSEATNIVYRLVLGLPPMDTTPLDVAERLSADSEDNFQDLCNEQLPERSELMAWLLTDTTWAPEQFREALATVATGDYENCTPGCNHEKGPLIADRALKFYSRIVSGVGERPAALITAEATDICNKNDRQERVGDFVLAEIVRQLGGDFPSSESVEH